MGIANIASVNAFQYEYIINKLYKTLDVYNNSFPELRLLRESVEELLLKHINLDRYADKLQLVCEYLYGLSVNSYIVRHLYSNFLREVQSYIEGAELLDTAEYYIELPRV